MKRGTRAIKCENCGKVVGWRIPTGEYEAGIEKVKLALAGECIMFDAGLFRHYRCKACAEDWGIDE